MPIKSQVARFKVAVAKAVNIKTIVTVTAAVTVAVMVCIEFVQPLD